MSTLVTYETRALDDGSNFYFDSTMMVRRVQRVETAVNKAGGVMTVSVRTEARTSPPRAIRSTVLDDKVDSDQ